MKNELLTYRRVPLSDTPNFRDLGGYATQDGKMTRYGVFFRAACPNSLSDSDKQLLKYLNVTTAVDLRGGGNFDETQAGFISEGITLHNIAIGGGVAPKRVADCPQGYMEIVYNPNMAEVFKTLADCKGAAVFHCFAGKDRTGIVAALLLMLAGVADEDIIADYTLSYAYFLKRIREDFARIECEKDVYIPHPEHMEGFLKLFRKKYCNVNNYLLQLGVSQQQINNIINKFVTCVCF